MLAAASKNRTVNIWNVDSRELVSSWSVGTGAVNAVVFDATGDNLMIACEDKSVRMWNLSSRKQSAMLLGHKDAVKDATFSPDQKLAASGSADSTLRIWSVTLQRELYRIDSQVAGILDEKDRSLWKINSVAFRPQGNEIASGFQSGIVRIFRCPICSLTTSELVSVARSKLPTRSTSP